MENGASLVQKLVNLLEVWKGDRKVSFSSTFVHPSNINVVY